MLALRAPVSRSLSAEVEALWPTWYGEACPPLVWLLGGTGRPIAQTAVTLYGLEAATGSPRLVAKVNRSRAFRQVTDGEYEAQLRAYDATMSTRPGSVAKPLGLVDVGGDVHLVSEYAHSDRSWDEADPTWRAERELGLAAWLAELHDRTRMPGTATPERARDVETAFADAFEPVATVRARLGEATDMVSAEYERSTEEILVHGDFWSGNWLFSSTHFTVIDWEHSQRCPSPILDEFLPVLSEWNRAGEDSIGPVSLRKFSDLYRERRGLDPRTDPEAANASLWVAAEVATRTYRRWGQVEDWSLSWATSTERLAETG